MLLEGLDHLGVEQYFVGLNAMKAKCHVHLILLFLFLGLRASLED